MGQKGKNNQSASCCFCCCWTQTNRHNDEWHHHAWYLEQKIIYLSRFLFFPPWPHLLPFVSYPSLFDSLRQKAQSEWRGARKKTTTANLAPCPRYIDIQQLVNACEREPHLTPGWSPVVVYIISQPKSSFFPVSALWIHLSHVFFFLLLASLLAHLYGLLDRLCFVWTLVLLAKYICVWER